MGKVYTAFMMVDEKELDTLIQAIGCELGEYTYTDDVFNDLTKLYVKLLKEKEDLQRERAKHKTESI